MPRSRSRSARKAAADASAGDRVVRLQAELGITFNDPELLRTALMHRSVVRDSGATAPGLPPVANRESNERLEFLGDAVLGHIAADYLYERDPHASEGVLTQHRIALVRTEQLVAWAREIGLPELLYLGQGERVSGSKRDRMLAGAFEALIGAIARDQGFDAAERFLYRFLDRDTAALTDASLESNPKGRLQEVIQEEFRTPPVYRTLEATGPAHDRTFTVEVVLDGQTLGVGTGSSKRDAEQAAATAALAALEGEEATPGESNCDNGRA